MAFNKMGKKSVSPGIYQGKVPTNIPVSNQNLENIILTTLDGGNLIFSEDGVAYVSNTKKVFIKKSEISSFNYEKLSEDVYRVKIASNYEVIDTTVNKNELKKLFMPISGQNQKLSQVGGVATPGINMGYAPSFSWLGPLLGFGAGMLAGSLLDDLFSSSHANPLPQVEHSLDESSINQSSSNEDDLSFPEDTSHKVDDIDVDADGFGIDGMDSTYDDFSQDLDDSAFNNSDFGDDLTFPDDSDLV
jgi:hypothetical protein